MARSARWAVTAASVVALVAAACGGDGGGAGRAGGGSGAPFPVTVSDDEQESVTLRRPPRRIVTFAPSHTETLFALGLGDRVVGVSGSFDDHPPEAQGIEAVGTASGTEPNVEKVVSLEPDLLLTAFIGGEWKDRLRDLGVPVFTTLATDFDDAVDDIVTVGRLTGARAPAERLAQDMRRRVDAVEERAGEAGRVTCFLELSDLFTVGPGSLEFDLLERAGCDPVTASADEPYPQWSVEQLVEDDPDVYLASEFGQGIEAVTDRPGIRRLRAVREGDVHLVEGDLISRPGPRLVEGLEALAAALHG